jgi:HD-like signal output (HDOD) protein
MAATAGSLTTRRFGRFELRRLLGKSSRTMNWLGYDERAGLELVICLPRQQPADAQALERWQQAAQAAARLNHPHLVPVLEVGVEERWPYIASQPPAGATLAEHLAAHPVPGPAEAVAWACDALEGLAYAHEAGVAHGDLAAHNLWIDAHGRVQVLALSLAAGADAGAAQAAPAAAASGSLALDPSQLRSQRAAGERDLVAMGLLLHGLLADHPALDQPDIALAADLVGQEIVRLPWTTPQPVPDTLRAIVNRSTERAQRQRYLSARTLLRALRGWQEAQAQEDGGPLPLLLDRMRAAGHLPARPSLAQRVARLVAMERQRIDEMVDAIVQDPALAFELLRTVNAAQFAGHGDAPVTTVRRAVLLIGLQGVRSAAGSLRGWPGPLGEQPAQALERGLYRARFGAHVAEMLCPAGLDAEEALLGALLQSLGRLLVLYHFPDEAEQIRQLMLPGPRPEPDAPEPPGMNEAAAASAVLGADLESLGVAVARYWGLHDAMLQIMRRLPTDKSVHKPDDRYGLLRCVASAANEAVDVLLLPPIKQPSAMNAIVQRYARALNFTPKELQEALQKGRRLADGLPAVERAAG